MNFLKRTWPLTVPLVFIVNIASILYFINHKEMAWIFAQSMSTIIVLCNATYIILVRSKSVWPNKRWSERLYKLLTFQK